MAGIGKKIKEAAMNAARDRVSGNKKGKHAGGSESGVDRVIRAVRKRLK